MTKGRAKRFGVVAAASIVVMMSGSPAHASDLSIPIDTTIDGGIAEGQQAPLTTVATVDLEGARCDVSAIRTGGSDTNASNDLIVSSGGDSTTLVDVERQPGAVTDGGTITLGPTLSVVLVMGEDRQFAASISVELDCQRPTDTPAPTTAASTTTSTDEAADAPTSASSTVDEVPNTGARRRAGLLIAAALIFFGALTAIAARRSMTRARSSGHLTNDGTTTQGEPAPENRSRRRILLGWRPVGDPTLESSDAETARRRHLPELYVTDHLAARILSALLAIGLAIGTVFWWLEAADRFTVPSLVCADCAPPDWFRWLQLIVAAVGIIFGVVQVVYFVNFVLRGVVWRRWRGVSIAFGLMAAAYTLMWWIDRIWL